MGGGWRRVRDLALGLASWVRVTNANGDVWESWMVGEVLLLFYAHPAVEISGEYMIVMTMKILWGVRGGTMEIIIDGSVLW